MINNKKKIKFRNKKDIILLRIRKKNLVKQKTRKWKRIKMLKLLRPREILNILMGNQLDKWNKKFLIHQRIMWKNKNSKSKNQKSRLTKLKKMNLHKNCWKKAKLNKMNLNKKVF